MLKFRLIGGILLIGAFLLSACGGGIPEDLAMTLTAAPDQIRTQAVGTFASDLTLTALAAPTNTPVPTVTPLPSFTPAPTLAAGGAGTGLGTAPAATTSCYGLAYVSDVTIPDNTPVQPGQKFTKTWKVQNTGSCAWDAGFKFGFVSGDAMGGTTYTLPSSIASGAVTDISISMTAPNKTGAVESDWQMSTANGQAFGQIVFVKVVVGGGAAATNSGSGATATSTATATATQE